MRVLGMIFSLIVLTLGRVVFAIELGTISEVKTEFLKEDVQFEWKKNPFQKVPGYASVKPNTVELKLDAIVKSEDGPMAMINDEYYSLGEYVSEKIIVEIGENYVLLEGDEDSLIELTLPPVRKPASTISVERVDNHE